MPDRVEKQKKRGTPCPYLRRLELDGESGVDKSLGGEVCVWWKVFPMAREPMPTGAFPLVFGDPCFKDKSGGISRLTFMTDGHYVYFRIFTETADSVRLSSPVRLTGSVASYLGDNLSYEYRPNSVHVELEERIFQLLEQLQADPDADLMDYARKIYHLCSDVD